MNNIRVINVYISGEPLSKDNINQVTKIIKGFLRESIYIKLYTNYLVEDILNDIDRLHFLDYLIIDECENIGRFDKEEYYKWQRFNVLKYIDFLYEKQTGKSFPIRFLLNKVDLGDYLRCIDYTYPNMK